MAFRLIPREEKFYSDFQALADELQRGAGLLEEMLAPDRPIWGKAEEIKEVEHKCDVLTHQIIQRLNRTFVTPLDREDIHGLARSLDDIMDAIDASATLVRLYRLEHVRFGVRELAENITACTKQVRLALDALESHKGLAAHAVEINRLENEADRTHQEAVSRLFDDEKDPIVVMKWKETLDFLEAATDRCEDVANVLEGVVVKYQASPPMPLLVIALVFVALLFDYINGFHDAANSIATVVSTRVLSPGQAVIWAAFFNFVAAFVFGTAVAKTVGAGMIDINIVTFAVVFGGLSGAIIWDLITWYFGLPTSSSHALIGGYAGAGVAKAGFAAIIPGGWTKTIIFIFLSPLIGFVAGLLLMTAIFWLFRWTPPSRVDRSFRRLQLLSAAFFSLNHGANDAQKTMGIIAGILFAGGVIKTFYIPFYVVLLAHTAIGLGTLAGGWRIIHTMGSKITKLQPVGGFAAETGAAIALLVATLTGVPVSTTHAITGSIVGVGATRRLSAVRWGVARQIVWAWVMTIPAAFFIGALTYKLLAYAGAR